MEWILVVSIAWIALACFALTLMRAASLEDDGKWRRRVAARLARIKSPAGRPFFRSARDREELLSELSGLRKHLR